LQDLQCSRQTPFSSHQEHHHHPEVQPLCSQGDGIFHEAEKLVVHDAALLLQSSSQQLSACFFS
jgi:hypothetical protein